LVVEDNPDDEELVLEHLRSEGWSPEHVRVQTPEAFLEALAREGGWDVVLSDYMMPRFDAREALSLLRARDQDTPFILVSGSVGEEVAVEAMRAGAQDFFPKGNITRLSAAVEREVREAQVRRERRRALAALREAERTSRLLVDSLRDRALVLLTPEGRVANWNRGAARLTGYAAAEALGSHLSRFYAEEARAAGEPEAHLAAARAGGAVSVEGWRLRSDGSRFWAESTIEAVREGEGGDGGAGGGAQGFSLLVSDTSERKRLVDALQEAVRVREDFLSIAGHELRTPLTSLLLHVQSLQRAAHGAPPDAPLLGDLRPGQLESRLGVVVRQAHRLIQLVQTLLDVTRLSSGPLVLMHEPVDLRALVSAVVEEWSESAARMQAPLHLTAPAPLHGRFDRLRLEGAVTQLLSNAVKYGAGKPVEVSLRAEEGGGWARLVVRDRGIGISAEDQARIFHRFERAVPDVHYGGFGLGLWIVRQVVEAHGGGISVESAPGAGAAFSVRLPLGG
jgi:PAS domain S-box-containing protein